MVEVVGCGVEADEGGSVEVRAELELVEDSGDGEPIIADEDLLGAGDLIDPEPFGGNWNYDPQTGEVKNSKFPDL